MRIDYLGLEAFVAIADFGSFQRAAEALHLSQAALSHRLKKIEDDFGAALLIRSSRGVSLTPLGQGLLPEVRRRLKELQDTYESARAGAMRQAKRLAFACLPSIAHSVLPAVLARMVEERPGIGFEILDIPVIRIADAVRSGVAEFGVTIVSAELSDLRLRPLADEEYRLFLRDDHPLAGRTSVTLDDVAGRPMARISSQSKNRQLLDVAFGDKRDRVQWNYEVQNATLALRLVASGMSMTILPISTISMAPASVVSIPFHDVRLSRTIGVVSRRGVPLSDPAAELLARIEAAVLKDFATHLATSAGRPARPRD